VLEEPINAVGKVARDLLHPRFARLIRDPCDVNPSRSDVDDEKHDVSNKPKAAQHLDSKEIGSGDCSKMKLDERAPTGVTSAFGRRFESVRKQRVLDSVARDFMAQILESPAEPRVAPRWILPGQLNDDLGNVLLRAWPSGSAFLGSVVLGSN